MAILTTSTRLTDIFPFRLRHDTDRLAIGNLRTPDIDFDLEFALHAIDDDIEMKLSHTRKNRLSRLFVRMHPKSRIFLKELLERHTHLLLVGLGFRFDRDIDDRLRKGDCFEYDRFLRITQRISGSRHLHSDQGSDVSGTEFFDFLPMIGVHPNDTTDTFLLILGRVQHV